MALSIYSWQDYKWVESTDSTEVAVIQPTYNHNTLVFNAELISGSVSVSVYYQDVDIPNNRFFRFCRLNSSDIVDPIIFNINDIDSFSIPIPNEYNYDYIRFVITSTSESSAEFNAWIKPASASLRGIQP